MMLKFPYVTQPENGLQAVFRFFSGLLVRVFAKVGVTPNQVTMGRGLLVIYSLYLFAQGTPAAYLWGAVVFYLFELLDHVDGDLARYTKRTTALGPLLEQFIDTWSSRPSNIFGLCLAYGMYRADGTVIGFALYAATAIGRLLWLEYRDDFGWERNGNQVNKDYRPVLGAKSLKEGIWNAFIILYTWNNTFLLLPALFYAPLHSLLGFSPLYLGFAVVAVINNLPWMVILQRGFSRAIQRGKEAEAAAAAERR